MMKIKPYGVNPLQTYTNQTKATKPAEQRISFADKIEISSAAKDMQVMPAFQAERAERVAKIKSDVQSGDYKVDSRKVAEDMLKYYRY